APPMVTPTPFPAPVAPPRPRPPAPSVAGSLPPPPARTTPAPPARRWVPVGLLVTAAVLCLVAVGEGSNIGLGALLFVAPSGLFATGVGVARGRTAQRVWSVLAVIDGLFLAVIGVIVASSGTSGAGAMVSIAGILSIAAGIAAFRAARA